MNQLIYSHWVTMVGNLCSRSETMAIHAALGMCGEAGEYADKLKKQIFYQKATPTIELKEELGDLLHYIQYALISMDSSLEEIMAVNIAKLETRYPDGWTQEAALTRSLRAEMLAMEAAEDLYGN